MSQTVVLVILVGLGLLLVLALLRAWRGPVSGGLVSGDPSGERPGASEGLVEGERIASGMAEMVEERVRTILATDPELAAMEVDFGTASDGSLEIWVDGERYEQWESVPSEGLRAAIRRAVADMNRSVG